MTIQVSPTCLQGCVVEFSRAELALPDPTPTVTISSTGGANMAFTPSGDMWMVTLGGLPDCYGTPCNKELVEFTKAQLSTSGSPAPAVTITSTAVGAAGSLWGPYGVAVDPGVTFGFLTSTSPPRRVRQGPAFRIWVARSFADDRRSEHRDELALLCRPSAVRTNGVGDHRISPSTPPITKPRDHLDRQ